MFLPSDTSSVTPEPLRKGNGHWETTEVQLLTDSKVSAQAAPTTSTSGPIPIATVVHQPVVSAPASVSSSTIVNHSSLGHEETSPRKDMANSSSTSGQAQATVLSFPEHQREVDDFNNKTQTCADMDVDMQNNVAPSLEQTQLESTMVATQNSPPSNGMQVDQPYTSVPLHDQSQADKPTAPILVPSDPAPISFHPHINQVLARRFCHFECNFQLEFSIPPHIYDSIARWKNCMNRSTFVFPFPRV